MPKLSEKYRPARLSATTLEIRGGRLTARDQNGKRRGCNVVGRATVLDDAFTRNVLSKMAWYLNNRGYPTAWMKTAEGKRRHVALHALVFEHYHGPVPPGLEIDHRDRDKLNNVPANLRMVTCSVNHANAPKRRNNTSGFKGVHWHSDGKKWQSAIRKNGKRIHLGLFADIRAAARAVNAAYREHYPDVAIPNPEVEG